MKTIISVAILALTIIVGPSIVWSGGPLYEQDPGQNQTQAQVQVQDQDQSQTAYGGYSASSIWNDFKSDTMINSIEKTQFSSINTDNVSIGEASAPVPKLYLQGQTETDPITGDRSNAIQGGIAIPITWGTGVKGALKTEAQRLKDRNLHEREKHQAEMGMLCMQLHSIMMRTGESISPELWSRCSAYEHFNNDATMKVMKSKFGHTHRHKAKPEMNENQYSPHSVEYTKD